MAGAGDATRGAAAKAGAAVGSANPARATLLLVITLIGLVLGGVLQVCGQSGAAQVAWAATTACGLVLASWWVIDAARHGRVGVDAIAVFALVGTLVIHEYLAGAVVAGDARERSGAGSPAASVPAGSCASCSSELPGSRTGMPKAS